MKEILVELLISNLSTIIELLFLAIGVVITSHIIPFIKTYILKDKVKITKEQLVIVMDWAKIFAESAYRLDKSGRLKELGDITKKDYVMEQLMKQIEKLNYDFTEEQLDEIRRSAVVLLEQTEKLLDNTVDELVSNEGDGSE